MGSQDSDLLTLYQKNGTLSMGIAHKNKMPTLAISVAIG